MTSLIDEAKEIIEMSLDAQIEKDAYALKAKDWLKKATAAQQGESTHNHHGEMSCAMCGGDLICPSCDEG